MNKLLELTGSRTVVPLDIALGISKLPFKISCAMMLNMAYWAVSLYSYQAAEDFYQRVYGIEISDDSIREVVNCIGKIVFDEDERIAQQCKNDYESCNMPKKNKKNNGVLYIQTDGAALNTRIKDQNNSTWRENKLGLVFSNDNIRYWTSQKGEECHKIIKREYVSYIGTAQEFKYHLLALALRNGYGSYDKTVILSDGATWIRNIKEELFPDAIQILDLFHLKENTYNFAKEIFQNDADKYNPWAEKICEKLENGKWKEVLKELEPYKNRPSKLGSVNLYTYISNNKDHIDYPTYIKEGLFVGSGAIESGNKIILQKRLKQAGMRWNVTTAQYVLALRSKLESKIWDSYVVPLANEKLGAV